LTKAAAELGASQPGSDPSYQVVGAAFVKPAVAGKLE
jgi:hypothetical protein